MMTEKMDPQRAKLNPRRPGKPLPERTDSIIMGLGAKQSSAPRVQHSSTVLELDSLRMMEVCSFLGRVFALDPYSKSLWPNTTELKTRMWLNAMVKAARWRHGGATYCVITCDTEGADMGVIKAAALWNLPTSYLTYVYLLFESLWWLGLRGTFDYFRAILFTMDSDFSDLYEAMHKRMQSTHQEPIYHLDFIGADPAYQGRGYGSSCLRVGVEVADKKSASVAMISSNPRNIPFYGRHGFTALSTKISAGVIITGMIRLKVQNKIAVLLTNPEGGESCGDNTATVAAAVVASAIDSAAASASAAAVMLESV